MSYQPEFHNFCQRTPCMLVLDTSGSMADSVQHGSPIKRIDELNRGLQALKAELSADDTAGARVQLAIISVGGPRYCADLIMDWTDARDFQPPTLKADGPTPLGQGMRLALHHIARQKAVLNRLGIPYTRPWIMVISDGEPSDSPAVWQAIVAECRAAEAAKRCVIFPIGVENGNLDRLQEISTTRAKRLSCTRFREYFLWLSASLGGVSRSRPGASVVLPATDPWSLVV